MEPFEILYRLGDTVRVTWRDGVVEEGTLHRVADTSQSTFYSFKVKELYKGKEVMMTTSFNNLDIIKGYCTVERI